MVWDNVVRNDNFAYRYRNASRKRSCIFPIDYRQKLEFVIAIDLSTLRLCFLLSRDLLARLIRRMAMKDEKNVRND